MYHYFIGDMELPLAPEKYTLRLPPANQTVRLADGRELNLLRPLGLREISFELLLPYFAESPLLRDGVAVQRPTGRMGRERRAAAFDYLPFLAERRGNL